MSKLVILGQGHFSTLTLRSRLNRRSNIKSQLLSSKGLASSFQGALNEANSIP